MIYFVLAEELGRIKIGVTNDPWTRLKLLQTGCPCDLKMLAFVEGDAEAERELHSRFAQFKTRGEWFDYAPAIREYVAALEPAPERPRYVSALKPICDAAGIGKGYASGIVSGKVKPPVALMLHLFKTIGWKHPSLQHLDDQTLAIAAEAAPYRRKGAARKAA